jgi:hypothetical protein
MKKTLNFFSVIALVFCGLVACGPKVDNAEVGKQMAHAICEKQKECAGNSAFAMDVCMGLETVYTTKLKNSGVSVSPDDLNQCLTTLRALECSALDLSHFPKSCRFLGN